MKNNCPFYGCSGDQGYLVETGGNQCALVVQRNAPCENEVEGKAVEWSACSRFNAIMKTEHTFG